MEGATGGRIWCSAVSGKIGFHPLLVFFLISSQLTMSSPGQPIPDFPLATHGPGRQAPYVTVRQAIQGISPHDRLHIPRPFTAFPLDGRYIDLDQPFTGTIMAGSSPYLHAEERRPFTHRESARVKSNFRGCACFRGGVRTKTEFALEKKFADWKLEMQCLCYSLREFLKVWLRRYG
jgi:hypothetical protein